MKLFGRKKKNHDPQEDDPYDEFIHSVNYDKPDKSALEAELRHIKKQIADAKEEHEAILAKLMPAKWELLDKKEQIDRITSEYEEISSKLSEAKSELDEVMRKSDANPDK